MAPSIPIREHFTYLQYMRLKAGFSRDGLAREVVRTTQTKLPLRGNHIRIIEEGTGEPSDEELAAIAKVLNVVPPSNLLRPIKVVLPEVEVTV